MVNQEVFGLAVPICRGAMLRYVEGVCFACLASPICEVGTFGRGLKVDIFET